MRGKFAETLLERPHTQVHVAGRDAVASLRSATAAGHPRIFLHPIFAGSRLSLGRLAAQWRYWRLLRRVAPGLVIVHAPELLPLTVLWQRLGRGRSFVYDVRENYALNVSTQRVYRGLVRRGLASGLRWVETRAAHRAAGIILAEASYRVELPFLGAVPAGRLVVLENKYHPAPGEAPLPPPRPAPTAPLRLLYSGTISELNGVGEAIAFAAQMSRAWPAGAHLAIVGYCQQPALLRKIQEAVAQNPAGLTLVGGAEPVPHARIVAEIGRSHAGLLPYRPHPSTERCRPTKLFEYLAHGLPIISSPNALWNDSLRQHGAGLQVDFGRPVDGPALASALQHRVFYPAGAPADARWSTEGKKLWLFLDSLI